MDCSHREERGKRLEQPVGERCARTDEDESEPEYEAGRPEEQLHDQGDRPGRRQDGVLALVRLCQTGREDEAQTNAAVDAGGSTARYPTVAVGGPWLTRRRSRSDITTTRPTIVATMLMIPRRCHRVGARVRAYPASACSYAGCIHRFRRRLQIGAFISANGAPGRTRTCATGSGGPSGLSRPSRCSFSASRAGLLSRASAGLASGPYSIANLDCQTTCCSVQFGPQRCLAEPGAAFTNFKSAFQIQPNIRPASDWDSNKEAR